MSVDVAACHATLTEFSLVVHHKNDNNMAAFERERHIIPRIKLMMGNDDRAMIHVRYMY